MKKYGLFILFFLFISSGKALAYSNNYQQLLPGSRIAAMGGAGCALGGDGETGFFNPAGIVFTKKDGINLSVSHYGFAFMYESARDNAGDIINKDVDHSSGLAIIPAVTAFTIILDKEKEKPRMFLNFALYVPSLTDLDGQETGENSNYENYVYSWQKNYIYHFYINFAYIATENLYIGAALVGSYSKLFQDVNLYRYDKTTPANSITLKERYNYITIGLGMSLGFILSFDIFRFGFTIKTKKIPVYSETTYTYIVSGQEQIQVEDVGADYQRPWEFYFGIALEAIKNKLTFSFDFKFYPFENQTIIDNSAVTLKLERLTTWNINFGVEFKFNPEWAIRAGFYTDNSATPYAGDLHNSNLRIIQVNRYGITIGGGFISENTKMNVAVTYIWGKGNIKIRDITTPGNYGTATAKIREILITIGSSYWFDSKTGKNKKKNIRKKKKVNTD